MKLIIKEYLSLLKESKELDELLPELLLSMGHKTISKAQIGTRQFGVDVASIGKDKDDKEKVFLFVIKQGDLSRADWDGNSVQDVRPSLNEVIDAYIPTHLEKQYSHLPKKIIVCTGGDLKQNVQLTWTGYTKQNSVENEIEFDFWGGDELSLLVENYLFNEHIIPKELRSKFRKTLALLNDTDYDLRDYYSFLNEILFESDLASKSEKNILKSLRLIFLALNIVYIWAKEEDNLKHVLLASERTLLNVWAFLNNNNLLDTKKFMDIASKISHKHFLINLEYCQKLVPLINVEDGLSLNGSDFMQESLLVFEQLGIFSILGILFNFDGIVHKNNDALESSFNIAQSVKKLIKNHKSFYNPVYDEHIIDISLSIFLLSEFKEIEFIDEWINNLIKHIEFAYISNGKYFPIDSDKFDDLVELNLGDEPNKDDYIQTSTLIPILAQWCIRLGLIENYKYLVHLSETMYKTSTLQIWYPDEELEKFMYIDNAGFQSGYCDAPIKLPKEISKMSKMMEQIQGEHMIDIQKLSCVNKGMASLIFISNRHFRMPFLANFWTIT